MLEPETIIHICLVMIFGTLLGIVLKTISIIVFKVPLTQKTGFYRASFIFNHIKIQGEKIMVQITATQSIAGSTPAPKDRKGNDTSVETGSMSYESTNPDVASVEKDADDENVFRVTGNKPGVTEIIARADADLGEGVTQIEGVIAVVQITAGQAVSFSEATFSTPEEQQV